MKLRKRTRRRICYAAVAGLIGAVVWLNWPERAPNDPVGASTAMLEQQPQLSDIVQAAPSVEDQSAPESTENSVDSSTPPPKVRPYAVVSGDTVEAIAQRFGLLPVTVLSSNQLTDESLLQVGQQLLIPAKDGLLYTVQAGDNLWDVATLYQVEVDQVIRSNPDIAPDALQPGQVLLLPGVVRPRRSNIVVSRSGFAPRGATPSPSPAPGSGRKTAGADLQWPLRGEITEYFGWRTHPVYGTRNYHEGIDIAIPEGTAVAAIAAGTVTLSEWYGGWGLTVKIDHGGGLVSRYSHNGVLLVKPGETVAAGQVIARSGNTGVSTGPHLDFGIYQQGKPVDPLEILTR